jgi:hypothetical protein
VTNGCWRERSFPTLTEAPATGGYRHPAIAAAVQNAQTGRLGYSASLVGREGGRRPVGISSVPSLGSGPPRSIRKTSASLAASTLGSNRFSRPSAAAGSGKDPALWSNQSSLPSHRVVPWNSWNSSSAPSRFKHHDQNAAKGVSVSRRDGLVSRAVGSHYSGGANANRLKTKASG